MQPRGLSGRRVLDTCLILLLAIGQLSVAAAGSEGDANDKRFQLNGSPYPAKYPLPFFEHPNITKLLLQRNFLATWTRIVKEPTSLQVGAGSRVELQCVVNGNPPPRVYWFSGTEAERQIQEMTTRAQEEGNNDLPMEGIAQYISKYVIDCVKPEDEGYRYCVSVSNDKVVYSQPSLLLVDKSRTEECSDSESEPTITLHTVWRLAMQGSTVILQCRVEGRPMPYLLWLDNMGNRIGTSAFARRTVLANGDLRIKDLKWSDMGDYICRVQSGDTEKSVSTFLYPVKRS
ncbi:neural/ectodermal development factor IMP-L2 isoform X1 [Harpegnathos saltator]|uniref:neural/ectodermal development factor IMP-L2 isoform X1 n=1 Tax=Harpegnathos saltator TaxID=610380 RepID=UPI00058B9387|nr:neural/ectodermal development factor IMP-L2 isoform X1 [Harpegnathos saltator]XP_011139854.1 neural/ectodermal development factor IMP-L2 isoform X1 [Harpegnathos saltator]